MKLKDLQTKKQKNKKANKKPDTRNFVAKHMREFNKATVVPDKKKTSKNPRKSKYKKISLDEKKKS